MKTEGIKVNPIISIDNHHSLNEVEFNNVRVPAKNVVGEVGKGWTVAKALLAHERTGIAGVADVKRAVRVIKEVAAKEENGGQRLLDDPGFQQRLADIEVELMALEFTELRTLATQAAGASGTRIIAIKDQGYRATAGHPGVVDGDCRLLPGCLAN